MAIQMQVTLKYRGQGVRNRGHVYAITKTIRGEKPSIGDRYMLEMPLESDEGFVWLNGCILGRVVDVLHLETRGAVTRYTVELKPMLLSLQQFQQVVKAPWLARLGWRITEASL